MKSNSYRTVVVEIQLKLDNLQHLNRAASSVSDGRMAGSPKVNLKIAGSAFSSKSIIFKDLSRFMSSIEQSHSQNCVGVIISHNH